MTDRQAADFLSLSGAIRRVAKVRGLPSLGDAVREMLYQALCGGAVQAVADIEDRNGQRLASRAPLSPEDWMTGTSASDFAAAIARVRVLDLRPRAEAQGACFAVNVQIEAALIDRWLNPAPHVSKISTESACTRWLKDEMRAAISSGSSRLSKDSWNARASGQFPDLSDRAFRRCWEDVKKEFPDISKAGRPPKSDRKS